MTLEIGTILKQDKKGTNHKRLKEKIDNSGFIIIKKFGVTKDVFKR